MSLKKILSEKPNIFALIVAAIIILFPIGFSIFSSVFAGGARTIQPFLEKPDPEYKDCVRDTEYMRFHHWELLREMREEAVRHRKRGDINVAKCRECHPNRERFCNQCHNAVNLTPDCWGCHYYPDTPEASSDNVLLMEPGSLPHQTTTEPDKAQGGRG